MKIIDYSANEKHKLEISSEFSEEFLSSDADSQKSDNESLELKFPDKIQMDKMENPSKSISLIPKLDFSRVQEKYNNENIKKNNLLNNNKFIKPIFKKELDGGLAVENKNLKIQSEKLKKKVEKYKNGYEELKEKYKNLKIQYKLCNNKLEVLELQMKKLTNRQSTNETTNKRYEVVDNTSMVNFII